LKTEHQLIRFEAVSGWNVVRHRAKCHWSGDWPWRVTVIKQEAKLSL